LVVIVVRLFDCAGVRQGSFNCAEQIYSDIGESWTSRKEKTVSNFAAAEAGSREMGALIVEKAVAVAGTKYSDILALTMR
jgi:hypothetical protein